MAVATYADPQRSPISADPTGPYEEQCAVLYERLLDRLLDMALHPEEFVELWIDEVRQLAASEAAFRDRCHHDRGAIGRRSGNRGHRCERTPTARPPLRCRRICRSPSDGHQQRHRVSADPASARASLHLHGPLRVLGAVPVPAATATGRPATARRALSTADATVWTASSPSSLTAQLQTAEESSLDRKVIVDHLIERLRSAPPAWNPYSTPG